MIGLPKEAGEYADAKLRELISGLSLETKVITEDFSVGYIFETSYGKAKEERLLKTRLIGRSEDTLVLDLGKHNGIFLCGKVPYSWTNCMILHRKPPTDIHDHIPILEEVLSDYELTFSPCEDRFIDDPHPDFTPENMAQLYQKAKEEILTDSIYGKMVQRKGIKEPDFDDALYYTLSEDLTAGGEYKLYDMSHLYALEFSETEQHPLKSEGGWSWDEGSKIQFVANLQDIAKNINGGMKKLRELMALHFGACNKIISGLIKGDYQLSYVAYTGSHDRMIYAVKAMFSIRISQEDGIADLVVHDPRNILLKKVV